MGEIQLMGKKQLEVKVSLTSYDILIFIAVDIILFVLYKGSGALNTSGVIVQSVLAFLSIFTCRCAGKIYSQIWRYGGIQCYIRHPGDVRTQYAFEYSHRRNKRIYR